MSTPIANRWNLPDLGLGLGLRGKHIPTILRQRPKVGWFEVIADNALIHQGWLRSAIDEIAARYPVVLHGVTMNLGSTDALDVAYLKGIKALADRWRVPWVSDHLCWTGIDGRQTHDLLPVPYSEEMLAWMTQRVRRVQDVLERPLVVENPSSYLQFQKSTMTEWEFLARLARDADCGLLLDVNNVYVSARNHGFAWEDYLAAMPWDRVCQMHVAGHTTFETYLFDSHVGPVDAPVWDVLRAAFAASGGRPLLLEWDFAIPSFTQTWREAQSVWGRVADLVVSKPRAPVVEAVPVRAGQLTDAPESAALMRWMLNEVTGPATGGSAASWLVRHGGMRPDERLEIHRQMYAARCDDALLDDYPLLRKAMGKKRFLTMAEGYRRMVPSTSWALERYGASLPSWLATQAMPRESALAKLELAQTRAHLAPTCPPLELPHDIADADHGRVRLHFAPATELVALDCAVLPFAPGPQHWLVSRHGWKVTWRELRHTESQLLQALRDGAALGPAMAAVASDDTEAEAELAAHVGEWLAAWVQAGAISRLEVS